MRFSNMLTRRIALVAALTLPICLVTARAAGDVQPGVKTTATSGYSAAALYNQANADAIQSPTQVYRLGF